MTAESHLPFVLASRDEVAAGTSLNVVLDTLEYIATKSADSRAASAASIAIYELGSGDAGIQPRLLRIVTDDSTSEDGRTAACSLLALDAEQAVRTALLDYVKTHWDIEKTYSVRRTLMDLGDLEYLRFFEQQVEGLPAENVMKSYYQREVRLMHAAQNMPDLLDLLSSGDDGVDRRWLVLQAARRAAPRRDVREAIRAYLRLPAMVTRRQDKSALVHAALDLGIFTAEDEKEVTLQPSAVFRVGSGGSDPAVT